MVARALPLAGRLALALVLLQMVACGAYPDVSLNIAQSAQSAHLDGLGGLMHLLASSGTALRTASDLQQGRLDRAARHVLAFAAANVAAAAGLTSDSSSSSSSSSRRLHQLAGTLQDMQLAGDQLSSTTQRNVRVTTTDKSTGGVTQVVSNDVSFTVPLAAGSAALSLQGSTAAGSLHGGDAVSDTVRAGLQPDPAAVPGLLLPAMATLPVPIGVVADMQGPDDAAVAEAGGSLSSTSAAAGSIAAVTPTPRIVGGVQAATDRKYVCSLRIDTTSTPDFHYCGCSLISPSVVLTAAHCLSGSGLNTPWVEIGRYFQQQPNDTSTNDYDRIKCTTGLVHPGWSESVQQNDLGLCFLEGPSRFAPVTLANSSNLKLAVGDQLTVMGWGSTSEGTSNAASLLEVQVDAVDLNQCSQAYGGKVGEKQLCAGVTQGGKDACQGDSGGPLVVKGATPDADVQVGIVSYGIGCGRPAYPGVYTDVRAYRDWIAGQMLARGVSYAPLTSGYAAATVTVDQATACACTRGGQSGSATLGASLSGCKQHSLNMGDSSWYCYTAGGTDCTSANPSSVYPGAAWITCRAPQTAAAATPVVATARPPAPASTSRPPRPSIFGFVFG